MASVIFGIGAVVAVVLLGMLVATRLIPTLQLWPTPGPKSWQSYVFWPLFRGLNVLCFAMAAAGWWVADRSVLLGLPGWLRLLAFAALAASVALFVYAFRMLGRDNSYGASDGLVTGGIYQWSRNPQNAMLVVVYGCLALAMDNLATAILCAAMMAVYVVMVLCEEPWLATNYGEPYRRYCREVPRFFNWRRAVATVQAALGRQ